MQEEQQPGTQGSEVLSCAAAAAYLGVHVETLRRVARRGEIPAFKIGKDWRFRRDILLRWMGTHDVRRREPHVLLVDDDPEIRDLGRRLLEPEGYRVATAADGEEALGLVAQRAPDLVLLDLKMPGMGGVGFLRRFRQRHETIPAVLITGYPDSELLSQAMRYPPVVLMAKPLEPDQLLRCVRVSLNGSLDRGSG